MEAAARSTAMTETMCAVVVLSFDEAAQVREVAKPVAGSGKIVVRIDASGLCHTDIHGSRQGKCFG